MSFRPKESSLAQKESNRELRVLFLNDTKYTTSSCVDKKRIRNKIFKVTILATLIKVCQKWSSDQLDGEKLRRVTMSSLVANQTKRNYIVRLEEVGFYYPSCQQKE